MEFKNRFDISQILELYAASEGNIAFANLMNLNRTMGIGFAPYVIVKYDIDNDEPVRGKDGFLQKVKKGEKGLLLGRIDDKNRYVGYTDKTASDGKILRNVLKKGDACQLEYGKGFSHIVFKLIVFGGSMYNVLFSPITINKLEIKNRIAYPSLATVFSYDMKVNDRHIEYFREKARGGAGIVTFGPVGIDDVGAGFIAPSLASDDAIPDFKKLATAIKSEGARAWVQFYHAGAYSSPMMIEGKEPIAPSAIHSNYSRVTPREMTMEDIREVQESFASAAARAKEAGFDGVEIIGSAGYLICQFLSPLKNQRTDEYGGKFENRVRFPREVIELTRKRVGPDFPVTIRMAGNDFVPGSNTDSEMPAIAKAYEEAGIDAINVTGGWHEAKLPQMTPNLPRGAFAYLAKNIRDAVSIPIIASNRITTPNDAEEILCDGFADMVNLGRPLIADPYWPQKAQEGIADEIRHCIACLQGCMDSIMTGQPLFCVANPFAGLEGERKIEKAASSKKVMIIGAGLAGLEAAITATIAGHDVEIFEKDKKIGGQMWVAAAPPHKQEMFEFLSYYRAMLGRYDIKLNLGTEVDVDLIQETNPEYIIIRSTNSPY